MLVKDARYSGDGSLWFWNRVNALRGTEHEVLYALGCILQNLEDDVLRQLKIAEIQATHARARRRKARKSNGDERR